MSVRQSWDEMTLETARGICASVVENKIRWGKQWDGSEIGFPKILDALVVMAKAGTQADDGLKEQLVLKSRQLGAALAREKKYRKKLGLDTTDTKLEDADEV